MTLKKRHLSPLEAWNEALEMGAPIDRVEDWDAEGSVPSLRRNAKCGRG